MIVRPEQFAFDREKRRETDRLATDETLSNEQRDLVSGLADDQPFFSEVQSYCFYCGEKLTIPAVMWHGNDGKNSGDPVEIWLHPKCAENLSARITRDTSELKVGKEKADQQLAVWKRERVD